jgi:hypothetical protein
VVPSGWLKLESVPGECQAQVDRRAFAEAASSGVNGRDETQIWFGSFRTWEPQQGARPSPSAGPATRCATHMLPYAYESFKMLVRGCSFFRFGPFAPVGARRG